MLPLLSLRSLGHAIVRRHGVGLLGAVIVLAVAALAWPLLRVWPLLLLVVLGVVTATTAAICHRRGPPHGAAMLVLLLAARASFCSSTGSSTASSTTSPPSKASRPRRTSGCDWQIIGSS